MQNPKLNFTCLIVSFVKSTVFDDLCFVPIKSVLLECYALAIGICNMSEVKIKLERSPLELVLPYMERRVGLV